MKFSLKKTGALLLDGALATELERAGIDLNNSLWSAWAIEEFPQAIMDVHLAYLRAGVDIISTATYQASLEGLLQFGFSHSKSVEIIEKGVALAQQARDAHSKEVAPPTYIAGSCGPYGAYMADGSEYSGNYSLSPRDYVDFHFPRTELLIKGGVDLIAFETFPKLEEALAVHEMMSLHFPETPFWISFVTPDGKFTGGGDPIAKLGESLPLCNNFIGLGVNCSHPKFVTPFLQEAAKSFSGDFIVYPNSGEGFDIDTRSWTGEERTELLRDNILEWNTMGARIFGGCCRTGASSISLIGEILDALRLRSKDNSTF